MAATDTTLDEATRPTLGDPDRFATMVGRLSRLSVTKHFDAYADIDWDAPEMAVRVGTGEDSGARLPAIDPIADTDWYRGLTPAEQSDVAMYRYASCMRTGWHFENVLQQGLLAYTLHLPNGSTEFRYLNHEIIEEGQHTLMFQEFVDRTGLPVRGMPHLWRTFASLLTRPTARRFPALFFLAVLGGEEPVDHLQRQMLREGVAHPLVERILRIHVTEEARHVSFANHLIGREVAGCGPLRRAFLAVAAPVVLGVMGRMMVEASSDFVRHTGLPKAEARRANRSAKGRALVAASVAKPRELWEELGLRPRWVRPLWRALGVA